MHYCVLIHVGSGEAKGGLIPSEWSDRSSYKLMPRVKVPFYYMIYDGLSSLTDTSCYRPL